VTVFNQETLALTVALTVEAAGKAPQHRPSPVLLKTNAHRGDEVTGGGYLLDQMGQESNVDQLRSSRPPLPGA